MKGDQGIVYVVYGLRAVRAVKRSIETLKIHNRLPIVIISDVEDLNIQGTRTVRFALPGDNIQRSRQAKLHLLEHIPDKWKYILYLDADTEVHQSLGSGFEILKAGWDLVITPSDAQEGDLFRHIGDCEKASTIETLQNPFPLQLQAGVIFINRSPAVKSFFGAWYHEWLRFRGQDQAAMLRALDKCPVRICLLSRAYNGGDVVQHHFGRAR